MAKSNYNSLNLWRGRIAGQVYKSVRGKQVIATFVEARNPKTAAQRLVRAKMALLGQLASKFRYAIRVGFRPEASKHRSTPVACFVNRNYDFVQGTSHENVVIAPEQILVSIGSRTGVEFSDTIDASSEPQQVTLTIIDGTGTYDDEATDKVYGILYCEELQQVVMSEPVSRTDSRIDIRIPKRWLGMEIYAYGFVTSKDGTDASKSSYIGHATVS